ncbi:MAG: ArsR/SmtB family transcription factor [Phycisphaeraceae bacterium]
MQEMNTCRPKPPLANRPLLGADEAGRLGVLFKSLSHPTRLRIIHALIRSEELSVGDLAEQVEMTVQAVSNQLQRLAESRVVDSRREGLQVFYQVIDPCVPALLERGWCHVEEYEVGGKLEPV